MSPLHLRRQFAQAILVNWLAEPGKYNKSWIRDYTGSCVSSIKSWSLVICLEPKYLPVTKLVVITEEPLEARIPGLLVGKGLIVL